MRAQIVSHIPELLDELGVDTERIMARAGLSRELMASPDAKIGFDALGRLIHECLQASGRADFGLLIGERSDPAVTIGDLIELMKDSPTVGVALRAFVLHHHLNDSGGVPMLMNLNRRRCALGYSIDRHDVPAIDAFYDASVVYGLKIMRVVCGAQWMPLQVDLARKRPADPAPYLRIFGPNVRFESTLSAIEFPAEVLDKPVAGADPQRYRLRTEAIERELSRNKISLADQVKRAIRPLIFGGTARLPAVTRLFSLHERVLRARLAAEGTTFRGVLLASKLEISAHLLQSTELTVNEIGAALGYRDTPSFVRAFKRGFGGSAPGAFRAQVRAQVQPSTSQT